MMKQLSVYLCLYVCLSATIFASQLHCTINCVSPYISTTMTVGTACNFTMLRLGKSGKSENLECMVECLIVSSLMWQLSSNYWLTVMDSRTTANNPNTKRWKSHCVFWQTVRKSLSGQDSRLRGLQQKPLTPANEAELLTVSPRLVTCHELLMRTQ
jgi:hypothetical protein